MTTIEDKGAVKLITSTRNAKTVSASSVTGPGNNDGTEVSLGGTPISAIIRGKEIPLYQHLDYIGYKLPITTPMGGGAWEPLYAEIDSQRNNINLVWQSTYPQDQPHALQALSFSITTGEWNGIFKADGTYDTDLSAGTGGARGDCTVRPSDPEYASFLERFDYIINPKGAPSFGTTSDNLTGIAKKADVLTFGHAPVFEASNADRIINFNPKEKDKLQIQLSQFGPDAAGTFKVAKNAKALTKVLTTSTDFIYLKSAGEFYYNENGTAAGYGLGGVFAVLEGRPNFGAKNISFL